MKPAANFSRRIYVASPTLSHLAVAILLSVLVACATTSDENRFRAAIADNDVTAAQVWIDRGLDPSKIVTVGRTEMGASYGLPPLHHALLNRYERMARLLLSHGVDATQLDKTGRPPMAYLSPRINSQPSPISQGVFFVLLYVLTAGEGTCSSEPTRETTDKLLEHVANVDLKFPAQNKQPTTALIQAAACGHVVTMHALLAHGAHANVRLENGTTAIAFASAAGYANAVRLLLEQGANSSEPDAQGVTPLMLAASAGDAYHFETVQELIGKRAAVDAQDKDGDTALIFAVHARDDATEVVRALVAAGANPDLANKKGETARLVGGVRYVSLFPQRS